MLFILVLTESARWKSEATLSSVVLREPAWEQSVSPAACRDDLLLIGSLVQMLC